MNAVAVEIIKDLHARGGTAYRYRDCVRIVPAASADRASVARIREQKSALLAVLPPAPPEVAALPTGLPKEDAPWIFSTGSAGDMRLVVASDPPWPDGVFEAAALLEVIDFRHQAGHDALAQVAADRLEIKLAELRDSWSIDAWLAS